MTFVQFGRGLLAGAALTLCAYLTANAQGPAPTVPSPTAPPPAEAAAPQPAPTSPQVAARELTAIDVEAFFDGIIPLQLGMDDIAGATVAIVKDGKLLFAKGYGFADMETRKPVAADKTLFMIGSITKLFTWTAVMQLVEEGKIDLDADVAQYIDYELPKPFGKPVTMRNLMTHRPGWEDVYKEIGAKDAKDVNLEAYLKEHIPAQIYEPGTVPAYSNYGAALAGYIVQRVSGMPFDTYVEARILKPLGMTHTAVRQPMPDALKADMSMGYGLGSADEANDAENVNAYPAGSMASTATDMARFMIAHLNDGELDGARILKAETAQAMHDTRLETDSRLNAHALGFYESTRNGQRAISHGGDTVAFHSDMHLILDQKVGFFISYNSAGRGDTPPRSPLWRAFLDRYFPYSPPNEPTLATAKEDAQKVIGVYRSSRRGDASWTRLIGVLQETNVSADEDGILTIDRSTDINGQPRKWREVGPLVYRNVVGQEYVVFKPDAKGTMTMFSSAPIAVQHRVGPLENQMTILIVALGSMLIMGLTVALWPVAAITRWHYGAGLGRSGLEHLLRYGTIAVCAANIAFIVGFMMTVLPALETIFDLDRSLDAKIHPWQYLGIAGAIGSVIPIANAVVAWGSESRSFLGRIKEIVIAIACVGFAWFAWSMNLLDLSLRY